MLFGNPELFDLARSAKLRKHKLVGGLAELRNWISSEFNVSVVHIVHDAIDIGPHTGRPRLNIILETDNDYHSWKTDVITIRPDVRDKVLRKFASIAKRYPDLPAENVHLILDNFSDQCLVQACYAILEAKAGVETDAEQIVNHFNFVPIWQIDGWAREIVVFLHTDEDIQQRTDDGTCQLIADACFKAVKQYDEFNYLSVTTFRLRFDSKQNLDKNYKGNLLNYWR